MIADWLASVLYRQIVRVLTYQSALQRFDSLLMYQPLGTA